MHTEASLCKNHLITAAFTLKIYDTQTQLESI